MTSRWFWGWVLSLSFCWRVADRAPAERTRCRSPSGRDGRERGPGVQILAPRSLHDDQLIRISLILCSSRDGPPTRRHALRRGAIRPASWPRQTLEWASRVLGPLHRKEDRP